MKRYFYHLLPGYISTGVGVGGSNDPNGRLDILYAIHEYISQIIFETFLARTLVDIENAGLGQIIANIDTEVHRTCQLLLLSSVPVNWVMCSVY
jgi:hypothetical protein